MSSFVEQIAKRKQFIYSPQTRVFSYQDKMLAKDCQLAERWLTGCGIRITKAGVICTPQEKQLLSR